MLKVRIVPCLDFTAGRVVKGVKFQGLRDAGDPVERASAYQEQGADELVMLDVSATVDDRAHAAETIEAVREVLRIPLTVGGGVRTIDDARRLLDAGADKVSVNTAAVERPALISEMHDLFGAQCTILAIDAAGRQDAEGWEIVVRSGRDRTGSDAVAWAAEAERLGCGEVLLTSWDRDGTRSGYDTELLSAVANAVRVPIIASGGADSARHMAEAAEAGADALLAASIFHDGDTTVEDVKKDLMARGLPVRRSWEDSAT